MKGVVVVFDLETTGVDVVKDKPVEIALMVIKDGEAILKKRELLNPGIPISPKATEVHGITNEMVADKPTFARFAKSLAEHFMAADYIVGHNIVRFDIPMLVECMLQEGIDFEIKGKVVDTLRYEQELAPRTLEALYKKYTGVEIVDAHSALGDVESCYRVLLGQQEQRPLEDSLEVGLNKDTVDYYGKIGIDAEGDYIFLFGKHDQKKIKDVPYDYIRWMISGDFPLQVKRILEKF